MASNSITSWDFYNYHVQQDLRGGQFVSAESTLVAAGPPRSDDAGAGGAAGNLEVFPIGLLESVAISQNKQLQRIFEIGSIRSYFIPGRTIGSLSIGRTFYFGPSLLRVLYAYYRQSGNEKSSIGALASTEQVTIDGQTMAAPDAALLDGTPPETLHRLRRNPGHGYFLIDLASDLFAQPTGMAIYFKDANATSLGAFYLNECYVQGHQMTVSSGSVLVMEGVSLQFDSITPLKVLIG